MVRVSPSRECLGQSVQSRATWRNLGEGGTDVHYSMDAWAAIIARFSYAASGQQPAASSDGEEGCAPTDAGADDTRGR